MFVFSGISLINNIKVIRRKEISKMLKIRALNRESSSDEDAPSIRREAQVYLHEGASELYFTNFVHFRKK